MDGRVPCRLVELLPVGPSSCSCEGGGHATPESELSAELGRTVTEAGLCDNETDIACDSLCLCELLQYSGSALEQCQEEAEIDSDAGFCYINAADNEDNIGNPELLLECPEGSERLVRWQGLLAPDSTLLLACDAP
jgi:hypothetical protein